MITTRTKTPLQAVVSVICDCLSDLPAGDQARALEAARVTLGLNSTRGSHDLNPYQDAPRLPLPLVEVQMMNDRPVVVNPPADQRGQRLVVAGPRRTALLRHRQLTAPAGPTGPGATAPRGYVRPVR